MNTIERNIIVKRILLTLLTVAGLALSTNINPATASPTDDRFVPGRVLVKFYDNRSATASLRTLGLPNGEPIGRTGAHIIPVPEGKEEQLVAALSHNKNVEFAELDTIVQAVSNDYYFPRQYALENTGQSFLTNGNVTIAGGVDDADVDAPEAWAITRGDSVVVAVLDSGITSDNLDITPKVVGAINFSDALTTEDNYGHGTHVAGIVAASTDNGDGVAGTCPDCSVLNVKVLNDSGVGSSSSVANGISWAADNGAQVINMSLGSSRSSRTIKLATEQAWNSGAILVAAAGNSGSASKLYPAAYDNVIAVAATNNFDQRAGFSNYGSWVDVAAPGENIFSTFPNHSFVIGANYGRAQGYDVGSGTSMASPIVAGIAALTISAQPGSTNADIRAKVAAGSDKISGTGQYWIYGRVNAYGSATSTQTAPTADDSGNGKGIGKDKSAGNGKSTGLTLFNQ